MTMTQADAEAFHEWWLESQCEGDADNNGEGRLWAQSGFEFAQFLMRKERKERDAKRNKVERKPNPNAKVKASFYEPPTGGPVFPPIRVSLRGAFEFLTIDETAELIGDIRAALEKAREHERKNKPVIIAVEKLQKGDVYNVTSHGTFERTAVEAPVIHPENPWDQRVEVRGYEAPSRFYPVGQPVRLVRRQPGKHEEKEEK